MAKKEDLSIVPFGGAAVVAVPDYINQDDHRGTENIGQDDITLPRLGLAQSMSPEIKKNDEKFIPGLEDGGLFNTLTREVYPEKFRAIIIRKEDPRWLEFYPRDSKEGKGIKDRDVPAGDPRTEWRGDEKPLATLFRDYVALNAVTGEPIMLSFKGSSLPAALTLNSFIKLRQKKGPAWSFVYDLSSKEKTNDQGTFYVFKVDEAGWTSPEAYAIAEKTYEAFETANVKTDDDGPDDMAQPADVPF